MRIPIADGMLCMMVEEQLHLRTLRNMEFTAYDVTRTLRQHNPGLDIPHQRVRGLVHEYMSLLLSAGYYQAVLRQFGPNAAICYEPAPISAGTGRGSRSHPTIPLLPLN